VTEATAIRSAVQVDLDGRLAVISLDSPPVNALSRDLIAGLGAALDAAAEADARVIVLCSALPKYFAAGADLKLMTDCTPDELVAYVQDVRGVMDRLATAKQPTIAAIDGHALGGGLELALACALRVAGPGALLGVPEIKLGLIPGAGGTQRLPRLVGRAAALDLVLSGRSVGGAEALRIGLIDRLTEPPSSADRAAVDLGRGLERLSAPALAAAIECVDAALTLREEEGKKRELEALAKLFAGADSQEGLAAFNEKRPPRFA
jgi:enoyl-CoA hydratase/carnithine racemase